MNNYYYSEEEGPFPVYFTSEIGIIGPQKKKDMKEKEQLKLEKEIEELYTQIGVLENVYAELEGDMKVLVLDIHSLTKKKDAKEKLIRESL